jgi:hypothetical protein
LSEKSFLQGGGKSSPGLLSFRRGEVDLTRCALLQEKRSGLRRQFEFDWNFNPAEMGTVKSTKDLNTLQEVN